MGWSLQELPEWCFNFQEAKVFDASTCYKFLNLVPYLLWQSGKSLQELLSIKDRKLDLLEELDSLFNFQELFCRTIVVDPDLLQLLKYLMIEGRPLKSNRILYHIIVLRYNKAA